MSPATAQDPLWIARVTQRDPVARRLRLLRGQCDDIIAAARAEAGLYPLTLHRLRGRPVRHPHPLPRREPRSSEEFDSTTHREQHQAVYVLGCPKCYIREYSYFKNHPEKAPAPRWWEVQDGQATPRGHAPMNAIPRQWKDPGWEKYHPSKTPGALASTIANAEAILQEARKVR